ncbi:claudin-15b isoform X2 [Triplophysa dalaica]|uniref:claudin-15b isoform X2 n=1 Tax=Triplophysa dalaica TaxID=1582913 RepID=UPI0024DF68BD|nr:claudin-15b isoform X2 [Triplophysa dalaica]
MKDALQIGALFMGFLGCVSVVVSLYNNYWRVSSTEGSVITTSTIFENLWMSCADDSSGVYNCWNFQSLLALPGYIQVCRALMITSIVMGVFGLVATLVGMQCSKVGGENYVMKGRVAGVGGIFFILQGLCTMTAVSWYAYNITQQFFDPLYAGIKYEIGEGLYIGWSSATLALCGGSCLLCSCRVKSSDIKKSDLQDDRTSDHSRHMQIVQTASTISCTSQYGNNAYV